jgi:hypothetical protein
VAFVRRFRERVKRDFGADLGAAQKKKRLWFSIEPSRRTRLDIDPTASFLAGTRAWRRTWGVEPPLLQAPVQALAPGKLLRRRRRRERGQCELRAAGREEEGGGGRTGPSWVRGKKPLGRTTACRPTMCTAWSTSIFAGTSAATGMVRTTARPASRSILRRTAGCTVIGCVARKPRLANAFSRRARSTDTARWFSAHHDVRLFTPPHGT